MTQSLIDAHTIIMEWVIIGGNDRNSLTLWDHYDNKPLRHNGWSYTMNEWFLSSVAVALNEGSGSKHLMI